MRCHNVLQSITGGAELYGKIGNVYVKSPHYIHARRCVVGGFGGLIWCAGLVYYWTASNDYLQLLSCTTCFWNSLLFIILLARDVIYISRAYATMSVFVCLSICLWRKCTGAL